MAEPSSRRYAHSEGRTFVCFDSKMRVVTCGHDCDVRILEGDESTEFSVSSDKLSAIVCYHGNTGGDVVAVGMDDNSVQAFLLDGTQEGLLMRFTAPVTYLAINDDHSLLAAGTSEFAIKVVETADSANAFSLTGHEAPILCVAFDPRGEYLASSSCDGSIKVWSLKEKDCVHTLPMLAKSNSVSTAKSLATLSWKPSDGKLVAIPVSKEVKLYDRMSWKCLFSLVDAHHKEAIINVVSWSPCGGYLASGGADGAICLWDMTSRMIYSRLKNENNIGITSLEWDPRGRGSQNGNQVVFGDVEGYVGVYEDVYPSNITPGGVGAPNDTLADDSLLMEGIPPDDIFDDFGDNDLDSAMATSQHSRHSDIDEDDDIVQSRKRRRMTNNDETLAPSDLFDDGSSLQSGLRELVGQEIANQVAPLPRKVMEFNEKLVQVSQSVLQPSSTPDHLQHRFMVYNLVGVVRYHYDDSVSMVEVDFHNTGTHHPFSLANYSGYSLAALSEQALVLASRREEDQPSQLQCTHFSSWDSNKEWTVSLPSKESILSLTMGESWIAVATNKLNLRLFTVGGVQREVLSLPGGVVTVVGWGSRLAIVYQTGLGTLSVFSLTVWVLDVQWRRELHPPHTLPLSRGSTLEWIGFSEEGMLVSYDSKGIVRVLSCCYGRSSWVPVLDTNKQLGNKSDHYFIVGMTHNPHELRAILCKGLNYPPVHPKPVMSTLTLKLPLCDLAAEKTQLEDEYIQLTMIRPPSLLSSGNTTSIQQLMKMFALACKSDREYRAYEIAAMLPDEHSMNLALTYASKTQHLRLARQISEMIQQKSVAADLFSEEEYDESQNGTAEDDIANDCQYARDRNEKLKRGSRAPSQSRLQLKLNISKFSNQDKCSKRINNDEHENGLPVNETKELFPDDAQSEVNGTESDVDGDGIAEDSPNNTPPFVSSGSEKRHNPFKMATPVSKKVQTDRKCSFLDNISTRMKEDLEKKSVKKADKIKGKTAQMRGKNKPAGTSKKSSAQSKLKESFFTRNKTTHSADDTYVSETTVTDSPMATESSLDDSNPNDNKKTELSTISPRQKLLAFAFNKMSD